MADPGRAAIFDMDGTLTRPQFDFDAIRREIGLKDEPILETLRTLPPAERARAEAILQGYETRFAAECELQPGAREAVVAARDAGFGTALMTRNTRASVGTFQARHGLQFDVVWTREDGPYKPSPEPVHRICDRLGATPRRSWVIGDYLFDLQCGRAAGARTVLLLTDGRRPDWADQADVVIESLDELAAVLAGR